MPRRMARIGMWGRTSAQTSALPRRPARGGPAGAPWARISFLFHPVMSQQFLPDRAAQKPSNTLLCQGIRHSDPATCGQHLAGIWQASEWGTTHLLIVGICSIMGVASTQARGSWGTSLCQHKHLLGLSFSLSTQAPLPTCPSQPGLSDRGGMCSVGSPQGDNLFFIHSQGFAHLNYLLG